MRLVIPGILTHARAWYCNDELVFSLCNLEKHFAFPEDYYGPCDLVISDRPYKDALGVVVRRPREEEGWLPCVDIPEKARTVRIYESAFWAVQQLNLVGKVIYIRFQYDA